MHAVIQTGGKQYRVAVGDLVRIEKIGRPEDKPEKPGKSEKAAKPEKTPKVQRVDFPVLVVEKDKETLIGRPFLDGAKVTAEIVSEDKAKKVIVYRYKRRKGYDKKRGHRQPLTTVKITDIQV